MHAVRCDLRSHYISMMRDRCVVNMSGTARGPCRLPLGSLHLVKGWFFDEGRIAGRAERHHIPGLQKQVQLVDRDFSASRPNEVWVADLWAGETRDMRR